MPSPLARLSQFFPGFLARPTPPAVTVETPEQRRQRIIAETKAEIAESRRRPAPSTAERVPSNYHGGVAGKVWFLPYLDSTTKDTPEIRAAMRLMRRDPIVKAAWEPQIMAVASEDYQVQPSEPGNPESEEQAKAFRTMIEDYLAGGMQQAVRAICAPLGSDGHSLPEKVWDCASRGKLDGKIVCAALKAKDTDPNTGSVRLEGDRFGNVTTVRAVRTNDVFPVTDFVYTRYLTVFDEPLGEAAFRPSYGAYWMRDTVRKLRIIHHEKRMAGVLKGTYQDPDDKGPLEAALAAAKTSTWLSVPEGCQVEAITLSTASEPDYRSFDESLRDEIMIGIAFAVLQQLIGAAVGGDMRGDSEVQKQISDLGPWLLMALTMEAINTQLAPDFVDYNYPYAAGGGYPKLTFGGVSTKAILEQQQVVTGAMQAGIKPSRKYYAKAWSIQEADPNDPADVLAPVQAPAPGTGGGMGAVTGGGPFGFSEQVQTFAEWRGPFKGTQGGVYYLPANAPDTPDNRHYGHTPPGDDDTADYPERTDTAAAGRRGAETIAHAVGRAAEIPAYDPAQVRDGWRQASAGLNPADAAVLGGHLQTLATARQPDQVDRAVKAMAAFIGRAAAGTAKLLVKALASFAGFARRQLGPYGWWAGSLVAAAAVVAAPAAAVSVGLLSPAAGFMLAPAAAASVPYIRRAGAAGAAASAAKHWGFGEEGGAAVDPAATFPGYDLAGDLLA